MFNKQPSQNPKNQHVDTIPDIHHMDIPPQYVNPIELPQHEYYEPFHTTDISRPLALLSPFSDHETLQQYPQCSTDDEPQTIFAKQQTTLTPIYTLDYFLIFTSHLSFPQDYFLHILVDSSHSHPLKSGIFIYLY
eukprot:UN00473